MIFRLFICLFFVSFGSFASETGLLGGEYSLNFTVLDTDERYPVALQMQVSDGGVIEQVKIDYSSYHCRAEKGSVKKQADSFVISERVTKGQEVCLPSAYKFIAQDVPDYSKPSNGIFSKVLNLTEGREVATVISDISFKATGTTSFLLAFTTVHFFQHHKIYSKALPDKVRLYSGSTFPSLNNRFNSRIPS